MTSVIEEEDPKDDKEWELSPENVMEANHSGSEDRGLSAEAEGGGIKVVSGYRWEEHGGRMTRSDAIQENRDNDIFSPSGICVALLQALNCIFCLVCSMFPAFPKAALLHGNLNHGP